MRPCKFSIRFFFWLSNVMMVNQFIIFYVLDYGWRSLGLLSRGISQVLRLSSHGRWGIQPWSRSVNHSQEYDYDLGGFWPRMKGYPTMNEECQPIVKRCDYSIFLPWWGIKSWGANLQYNQGVSDHICTQTKSTMLKKIKARIVKTCSWYNGNHYKLEW